MSRISPIISFYLLLLASSFCGGQVFEGHATHFDGLGTPYGGCGVPTEYVGTDAFVALNVFNTPNTGPEDFTRPIAPEDQEIMGEFQNGLNCGRWVKVTILEDCIGGPNSGVLGEGFCNEAGSSYQNDNYSGAVQYMIVTDACGDNNGWCRDDPFHLDLKTSSVNQFEIDGEPVVDMLPGSFNNRKIGWEYVEAPNYQGDIKVHFMQDSFEWWASIFITNLKNGIHGVQQKVDGEWVNLQMNGDLGQAYLLQNTQLKTFTIRVIDADDQLINNEREYSFDLPEECVTARCSDPATEVDVSVSNPILSVEKSLNHAISIFPNPATDQLTIQNLKGQEWSLYNAWGEFQTQGTEPIVDLQNLESGLYLLKIKEANYKVVKSGF